MTIFSGRAKRLSMGLIVRTPGVCGGRARVKDTRIPVWGLVKHRRGGVSDATLLEMYPGLSRVTLAAAWEYAATHLSEIEGDIHVDAAEDEERATLLRLPDSSPVFEASTAGEPPADDKGSQPVASSLSFLLENLDWKDAVKVQVVLSNLRTRWPQTEPFRRFLEMVGSLAAHAQEQIEDPGEEALTLVEFWTARKMLLFLASAFEGPAFPPLLPLVKNLDWTDPTAFKHFPRLVEGRPYCRTLGFVTLMFRGLEELSLQYQVFLTLEDNAQKHGQTREQYKKRLDEGKALFEKAVRKYDKATCADVASGDDPCTDGSTPIGRA